MKKVLILLAALSLLLGFQSSANVASGHGGRYRGPAGEVPPNNRDPKDPQPPPENPGTPTPPGGGGPVTPPDGGPGTDPGGDPGAPPTGPKPPPANPQGPLGPVGPGGPGTSRGNRPPPKVMGFENWLFWWAYNKDDILNLKTALKQMRNRTSTRTSSFYFGEGEDEEGSKAPTQRMIDEQIVPALEAVVGNVDVHPDIRGGALIALARCRGTDHTEQFFEVAKRDNGEDKLVQESAILALGIAQRKTPEIRDSLIRIVDDREYPFRGRCFAMISLGLLRDNDPSVFACLERRLDGSESALDVPVVALLAMGLIGDNAIVPKLTDWLDSGRVGTNRLGDLERAWVVGALGRIGDPEALPAVFDALRRKGLYTRRSAMIAMGQLLPQADERTQKDSLAKLARVVDGESDVTAKNFGMIAFGRIGGHRDATDDVRAICRKLLEKQFEDGGKVTERPYAALALGLLGFEGETEKPQEMRYEIAETIRKELRELKGDKVALGAQAIALGMLGDRRKETVDLLISILEDRGQEKKLRGAAAMALGLMGAQDAKAAVMKALEEREDRELRVETAVAAGLLGDANAVVKLVDLLDDPKASQFVLGSVSLALGQIGDYRSIGPMVKILEPGRANGDYPDLTRALVAVALGQIADQNTVRVLSRLSRDINYRASVPSLDEILTIL